MALKLAPKKPATLAEMGDDVRRAWRRYIAQGGDGTWRKVTETGFVPFARAAGLDGPNELPGETADSLNAWAAEVLAREPVGD